MQNEIDITEIAENMKKTFVLSARDFLFVSASSQMPWLSLPIVKNLVLAGLNWGLEALAGWGLMQAFFVNTALRKTSQAMDYLETVKQKNQLPESASDEEYKQAEIKEIEAFRNFVRIT